MKKTRIIFFERQFPSANMILIKDQLPILIDSGFGSDVKDTEQLVKNVGVSPEEFIQILLDEMIRSKAASWHNNHLIATTSYQAPQEKWMNKNIKPKDWKPQDILT